MMDLVSLLYAFLSSLFYPSEILPLIKILKLRTRKFKCEDKKLERCYELLVHHSRSFSTVIILLNSELRDYVCLLYLVLRALDTVEDHPGLDNATRKEYLINFHREMLRPDFDLVSPFKDFPPKEYDLIKEFKNVAELINKLPLALKTALIENVKSMGAGVAEMYGCGCTTIEDYNNYTKYVAGYVGIALTKGFVATGSATRELIEGSNLELAIKVGNFLQKTNIIKDFRADFLEGREFWPRCIVSLYLPPGETSYGAFLKPEHEDRAFACLLHMVYDALKLLPYVFKYYKMLTHPDVIRFVIVPQAMAICTLAHLLKSNNVFRGANLKMRTGLSARLMTLTEPKKFTSVYMESLNTIHDVYVQHSNNPYFELYFEACATCADALASVQKFASG